MSLQPTSDPPSVMLALSIAIGLPLALWSYKCLMMVLFQRKIIYMGYAPPGARSEQLGTDTPIPPNIDCEEVKIPSTDRVMLSTLLVKNKGAKVDDCNCVILYLQGNAGNPLHRLPVFSTLLQTLTPSHPNSKPTPNSHFIPKSFLSSYSSPSAYSFPSPTSFSKPPPLPQMKPVILAPAPRSYWLSTNRTPTEAGITSDYLSAFDYASRTWPGVPVILYGHSLGGAIAVRLLAGLPDPTGTTAHEEHEHVRNGRANMNIQALILENPLTSLPSMLRALYPQNWLPYKYLSPFMWDTWDALNALRVRVQEPEPASNWDSPTQDGLARESKRIRGRGNVTVLDRLIQEGKVMILTSEKDEVVPREMGRELYEAALQVASARVQSEASSLTSSENETKRQIKFTIIKDALHETAWTQKQWRDEMRAFIREIIQLGGRWKKS